jgi:hypothetical protein
LKSGLLGVFCSLRNPGETRVVLGANYEHLLSAKIMRNLPRMELEDRIWLARRLTQELKMKLERHEKIYIDSGVGVVSLVDGDYVLEVKMKGV